MAKGPITAQEPASRPWYHSLVLWAAVLCLGVPVVLESYGFVPAAVYFIFAVSAPRIALWLRGWARFWLPVPHRRRLIGVLALVLVVSASVTLMARIDVRSEATQMLPTAEVETVFLPPTSVLKAASFGYRGLMSDLVFIRAHSYLLSHLFGDRQIEWLDAYYQRVAGLDPYNRRVYGWFSQSVKYGTKITEEVLEASNRYSRDGIKYFPDYWRFYFDIGMNYVMEWQTAGRAEEAEMRRKAMPYFSVANALPGAQLPAGFIASLYQRDNDAEMALMHVYLNYWDSSPEERIQLRGNLLRLGQPANAERLKRLETAWKDDKPYVPVGLYSALSQGTGASWQVPIGPGRSWANVGFEER